MALGDYSLGPAAAPSFNSTFNSMNPGDLAAPDSVYAEYMRANRAVLDATATSVWSAGAPERPASPYDEAPGFYALQTFDPDPLGLDAQKAARQSGRSVDSNYVGSLVVAGKRMSREELEATEDGRAILAEAIRRREGHKRGFLESVMDLGITDLPFFGLAATVGGSISDAHMVGDIMRKAQAGEEITDEERLKLGRWSYENSRESTVGGMIGDIVRAAPGFMFEFAATGGLLSGVRAGAARAIGESSVSAASALAVNRGTKILAGELAEQAVRESAAKLVAAGAARAETAAAVRGLGAEAAEEMAKRVSTSIYGFVAETMGRSAPKTGALAKAAYAVEGVGKYSDGFIQAVSDNIARKAVSSATARLGASSAFSEWAIGAAQSARGYAARALLDFGTWGTETSTTLYTGLGTVRGALADALGASVVEAPIRGALMYLPNRLVAQPLVGLATGGVVSQSRLSMQASALRTGDRDLMDMSGVIAEGMNLLEYVSENAGRGFNSGLRAAGLAAGLAKPAERALVGGVGEILRADAKVEAGGILRKAIRKALGTTERYAARTADTQAKAISRYLARNGVEMSDDAVRVMVRSRSVPEAAAAVAGGDFDALAKRAVKEAMKDEATELSYKSYFRYWTADFMARNNFGPEQTLNAFQRMGYDGILGEMYEERYSDFMKGLCGLDDQRTHSFRENVGRAFRNIYPEEGWRQLVAEAVGFAVPAVTRAAVLNVQRVLGGDAELDRARAAGRAYRDAVIGMSVYEDRAGTFMSVMDERKSGYEADLAKAERELAERRRMLAEQRITDPATVENLVKEQSAKVADAREALERHGRYVADTLKANGIKEVSEDVAGKLMRFAVLPTVSMGGRFADKIKVRYSSEQLAEAKLAQDALLADAAFLGAAYDKSRQYGLGERDIGMWRRIAAKTVGIAGALICGEPALAQSNAARWASVDEGLDPRIAEDLGNMHREYREKAERELREANAAQEPTEAEVDAAVAKTDYGDRARDYVRSQMLLAGARMFAHSEMLDRAAIHLAGKRGLYFDAKAREFVEAAPSASPKRVPFRQFLDENRKEVESLRDDIGREVLRILTDGDTRLAASTDDQYLAYINLKPGDPSAVPTARALAARMSGFGRLVQTRQLAPGVPVEVQLAADATTVSEELVKAVAERLEADPTGASVPAELVEHLARDLQYPGATTDEALAKRRQDIFEVVRAASGALTGDVLVFQRHVDVGESRMSDDAVRTVTFTRNPATGLWSTTDEVRDGKTNAYAATWEGDDERLRELVDSNSLVRTTRRIVLTPARALVTDDPVLMLQKVGGGEELVRASRVRVEGGYDYSRVHPMLRLNDQTHQPLHTRAEAEDVLRREAFMAEFAGTHASVSDYNFEKAPWTPEVEKLCIARRAEYMRMRENVVGENGYLTLINRSLTAQGVECPGADTLLRSALGRVARGMYSIGLAQYSARHRSADYYVSVDYEHGIDPVSGIVFSAVADGLRRLMPRLGNVTRSAVRTFFRDLDGLVEKAVFDTRFDRETREALSRFRDAVTRAYESPSARSVATVAAALCCGQVERAAARGHAATVHDAAIRAIADEARSLGSYVEFYSAVDLFLGGTGFEDLRAVRDAGGDASKLPPSGVMRIIGLTGADPRVSSKPAGMDWDTFESEVNRYAAQTFKDAPAPKPRAGSDSSGADYSRLRSIFANAGFDTVAQVSGFLRRIGKVEPFAGSGDKVVKMNRSLTNLESRVSGLDTQIASLEAEVARLRKELADKQSAGADVGEEQEKIDARQDELNEAKKVRRDLTSRIADVSAAVKAGRSETPVVPVPDKVLAPPSADEDDEFGEGAETLDSVDVADREAADTPTRLVFAEDGTVTVVSEETSSDDFDAGQKETTIVAALGAVRAVDGPGPVPEARFREMLREFTDGSLPEETIDALWTYYDLNRGNALFGETPLDDVDDGSRDDGEDEGAHSADHNQGAKYAKAFSNKQLDRYLAFYRYVSPQNGREFQAGVNGIRDNIEMMKEGIEELRRAGVDDDPVLVATVRMLDALFNSEAVVADGVNGHADREALFTSRVMALEDGSEGVTLDQMIAKLLEHTAYGRPRFRQAAFFLSYLRSMAPEDRRRFMTLACCSVAAKKISMRPTDDGLTYTLCRDNGRYSSVSAFAAVGSFTGLLRMKAEDVRRLARDIEARVDERDPENQNVRVHPFDSPHVGRRLRVVADVLAPALGQEAPILQAITSPHMLDALRRNYGSRGPDGVSKALRALADGSTLYAASGSTLDKAQYYGGMPPMVKSVVDVLDAYANSVRDDASDAEKRRLLSGIVVTEFAMGLSTSSAREGNKDMSVTTPWAWALGAYTTGLPETVATANTIPERNPKIASKVAVSLQDAPPVVRQFMDKPVGDDTGFAYHAFRVWLNNEAPDQGAELRRSGMSEADLLRHFEEKVLPQCRQRLVWPNVTRSEVLAKCIDRDYTADERLEACAHWFAEGWYYPEARKAAAGPADFLDEPAPQSAATWFVPVYNGDHSAGVIMQIPTEVIYNGVAPNFGELAARLAPAGSGEGAGPKVYKRLADMVNTWLGFDAFGNDSKRSSLACSEFAGRSMRGVKYVDGKLVKGETRVHVVHNYAMEGHNDAFLGTTLATGYGLRVQQDVAKDKNTLTHKLHVMSGTGTDLTMLKSLVTAMWEYTGRREPGSDVDPARVRGKFVGGMATQALMDYIIKFRKARGDSDVSTSMLVDEDSVKVGVLNSKTMGHFTGEKDGKAEFEPLMRYVFRAIEAAGGTKGTLKGEALDKALCDVRADGAPVADADGAYRFWWVESSGERVRRTVGELLGTEETPDGGVEVNVVDGLSGKALDFSYADNSLMSYAVANVSHRSRPNVGSMPRNNALDGLTMGMGLRRAGLLDGVGTVDDAMSAIAAWGVLASAVGTDWSRFEYARSTGTCAEKVRNGADPNGSEVREQATRDVYKKLTTEIKPPLFKIDAPLVSSGAVYHEFSEEELAARAKAGLPRAVGEVRDHTADPFLRRMHLGSRVYSRADAALRGTSRSLGLAHVNVSLENTGFRYGWFVNEDALDDVYKEVVGVETTVVDGEAKVVGPAEKLAGDPRYGAWAKARPKLAMVERIFEEVARCDRLNAGAVEAYNRAPDAERDAARERARDARREARAKRDALMKLFRDHHGLPLSGYWRNDKSAYAYQVCFDDLFVTRADGTRGFDRSALEEDVPDPDSLGGAKGLWLAGTTFGLPRTPSYNGSMWCQTVRASTPCTEVLVRKPEAEGGGDAYEPGADAMVMPDPQTLKILGCDHDGDKTACYMYRVDMRTGTAGFVDPDDITPAALKDGARGRSVFEFTEDPLLKKGYVSDMAAKGYVREGRRTVDPETGNAVSEGLAVSDSLRNRVSNTIVRGYFDMSRRLVVDAGDSAKDFYGTPMARATKAQPLDIVAGENDPRWKQLKARSLEAFDFLRKSRIGDSVTGGHVSTSAGIADKARGSIVSWAGVLHLAQFSGRFDRLFHFTGDGAERFMKWVRFMYGVDGVSNATFDDIKEQICLRLGWTSGMMDTFIADMMFDADETGRLREPPTSSDEFFERIGKYVDSVAQHGSRFWMMVAAEPSDSPYPVFGDRSTRSIHDELRAMFGARPGSRVTAQAVCGTLGIIRSGDGRRLSLAEDRAHDKVLLPFVRALLVQARRQGVASMPKDAKPDDDGHYLLTQLVGDVSSRGGYNAGIGYLFSVRRDILGGSDVDALAADYLRWSNAQRLLREARDFSRAVNFMKADPGSGALMGRRDDMRQTFRDVMEDADASEASRLLALMYAANMTAYTADDMGTMQGRSTLATNVRDSAIGRWAAEQRGSSRPAVRRVIERLWAEQAVPPNMLMQLEGNRMTVDYLLAALVSTPKAAEGTDLMSGDRGLAAWRTMETMARAATAVPGEAGGPPVSEGDATSTLGFHRAFMALWGALYGLVSTSAQAKDFSALAYVRSTDAGFGGETAKGSAKYAYGQGLERLSCMFNDKDGASQQLLWDATDRILRGDLDPSRQRRVTNNRAADATHATTFVLSASNLREFLKEMGPRQKGERSALRRRVELAIRVLDAMSALNGGKEVEITPRTLLEQYFPIYATASARTSTPNPKSNSVVNVVRGLFARLSKLQALFDSGVLERGMNLPAGYRLMDMVDSTDLAVPLLPALAGGHLASLSGLSKEQLSQVIEELAGSEQRDGTYAYEDNDALNGLLALVRGRDDTGAPRRDRVRGNPRNRHVVGFLEGTQLLRAVHEYVAETLSDAAREAPAGTPAEANEHDPEAEEAAVAADPGEKDPDVQRLADFYQNCLGTWADVEYKGGDLIVIRSRGGLKGSAATMFAGAMFQSRHGEKQGNPLLLRTDAVIQVRVGGQKDRNVTADVNSPAFAASFCNALRGADGKELVSADDYLRLTRAEREWLVNAYAPGSVRDGVANFSLAKPTWSISEDGVALLCGQIHLADAKSHRKALHEYFHSMVGMFRTMGVFGEADVKALAAKYGKAPRGSGMLFNEEKAADDFAKFVDGATRGAVPAESGADGKTVSIFRRILDLLKSLLNVMKFKYGFEYKSGYLADDEHNVLFGMVLHGYAIQSTSRLRERGVAAVTEETAGGLADRIRFTQGLMRTVDSDSAFDSREVTSGSGEWNGDANAQEEATAKSARTRMYRAHEAKDPMEGYTGHKDPETARFETGLHNALKAELERRAPRKTAIRELVAMLSAIRAGGNGKAFDRFRYRDAAVYMAADADGWLDGVGDGAPSAEDLEQMARDLAPAEGATAPVRETTPGVTKEDVERLGAAPDGRRATTPEAALAEMTLEQKRQAEEQAKERLRKWREEQGKKPAERQPTSEDVKEAGKARLDSVEEREPDLPEGVAEPLAEFESALEMADRYDPVDRGRRPGVVAGPQRELRAVVAAARGTAAEMDAADLEILSGKKVVHNVYEQLHEAVLARREVDKRRLRHAVHAREMATAAAGQLTRITGDDYSNPNTVNVLIHLYDSGYFKDAAGRTSRQRGRAVYGTRMGASGGDAVTHAAKYASAASMAGAVLAAGGQRFGNVVDRAIREIRALAPLSNGVTTMMIRHVLAQLEAVSAAADPTRVLEDSREWNAVLDSAAMNLFTGVKRGEYDSTTHDFGDYVPADSESELAERNRALYQFTKRAPGEPAEETDARTLRQKVLRMAADALFATAAQVKFMREFGLGEGSIHHDGWTGKVTRSPAEFTEMTQAFGIGAKTLAADSPLVERWNEPVFVAANLDEWYSGTVRETFGSLPVRDMMLQASRRVRGEMSTLVRKVNFLSMKWGVNRAEGRKLLKYKRFEATHEMRPGEFIKAVKDKRYVEGFSNEHGFAGETIDATLTEDQVRDVQLLHTYATALLRGDDKLVTGIDKISFLPGDFLRYMDDDPFGDGPVRSSRPLAEDDLSPEALARRYDLLNRLPESQDAARSSDFREMTSLENALRRLGMQWQSSVTGVPYKGSAVPEGSIDLYHRFARAALDAAKEVMARHGGSVEHPPKGLDSAVFNHEMLRILEAKGLVVATSADDSKTGEDGAPLLTEAVICIQGSDIDRMWEASSARELLVESRLIDGTDEERELRRREFTAKALADDLGESVVEFKRAVRDLPWITRGEGRYLTSLDTMIPEFEGGGTFMYHANRLERDRPRDQRVRLARHEMTWRNMLSDLQLSGKNFEQLTGQQLRMIHDYFDTPETGAELMAAFKAGKYARGTAASVRTGLEVNLPNDAPDATTGILGTMLSDVCSQIYRKQLERRLLMLEGRLQADFETEDSIGRMLHEYEQATESGLPVAAGNGLNATQLYRLHGKLPVNFTIGHALVSLTRGVQNALYFQSTLTSMLFTPDAEGDPLYFANPDRFNAANGCIPDATWRAAAQWWASRLGPSVKYDIAKSGVENARAIYEMVQSAGKKDGATYANFRRGAKRYASLGQDDLADAPSIAGFMAQLGEDDSGMVNRWGSARGLFSLDGSEALGYARHLFQATRLRGGHLKWLNRVMSWSKSMSVAYSVFFPIATKWESPAAAVGALATMGSNWSPELVRKHGKALSKVQQFFTLGAKEGWLDENFLGFKDVIRMMDTDDPFLNDLVMWAEAIGVSMTDRLSNVMEPDKGIVVQDIKTMAAWIRRMFGDKAGANFEGMADALFLRQGEKAFTYALNATKLAVAAQVALRLKAEATRLGKAFDPIRDMRGYAEYVDSEVGGVNPLRYAWAHPQMRSVLNKMWFSWEWTRTAWEAAGGGLVEEVLFGGHTISRGQKNVTLGRWLRMYGAVMIGFPFLLQLSSKFLANALAWAFGLPPDPDDDRDKWFTWENDSKIGLSAANITPLLRLVSRVDDAYLGGNLRDWKLRGQKGTGLAGAVAGGLLGMYRGGLSGAALGAGAGAVAGAVAPGLLPEYTGTDSFNTNRSRQYFAHGGKQGWEVTRWFTDPFSQFVSKLSMPLQKLIEGVVGFSLSNPDFRRPMSDKSLPERWLDVLSPDSAWANLLGMFRPFTMGGWSTYGDAGIISCAAPVQMGSSASSLIERGAKELNAWARNDRGNYAKGRRGRGKVIHHAQDVVGDLYADARAAGIVDFNRDIMTPVLAKVVPGLYRELFNALPSRPDGHFDRREVERVVRALHRIGVTFEGMTKSIMLRYEKAGNTWRKAGPDFRRRVMEILREAEYRPFGPSDYARENPARRDY